jgi:hypothetical protein
LEAITRQLETERTRIREVLTEMLAIVDKKIQPQKTFSASRTAQPEKPKDQLPGTSFGMPTASEDRTSEPSDPAVEQPVSQRDSTGSTGQPTQRMPVASLTADEDDYEESAAGESIRDAGRGARERLLPGQQREMFAPGLQSNQADTRAIR